MTQISTTICVDKPLGCETCGDTIILKFKEAFKTLPVSCTQQITATLVKYTKEYLSSTQEVEIDPLTGCQKTRTVRAAQHCYNISYNSDDLIATAPSPLTCLQIESLCCLSCEGVYLNKKIDCLVSSPGTFTLTAECPAGYFTGSPV